MKHLAVVLTIAAALALTAAAQQPTINGPGGVFNAASWQAPPLPNSGIAQGAMFTLYGTNMGPSTPVAASSLPLGTNLGGSSVKVTVGGTSVDALMFFAGPNQISAILPSNTPTGTGTVAVTRNGTAGPTQPITVVANQFGVFTVNGGGTGTPWITDANYKAFGPTASASPGQAAVIWGTGLGALASGQSDANAPQQTDRTDIPVRVYVGGVQATVLYRGRAPYPGEDQINFTVPQGVTGCMVPVVVAINNTVSRPVNIPVSTDSSHVCSDASTISSTDLQALLGKDTFNLGTVSLAKTNFVIPGIPAQFASFLNTESGSATFEKYTPATFAGSNPFQLSSVGSCFVFTQQGSSMGLPTPTAQAIGLDAGAAINVKGATTKQLTPVQGQKGLYSGTLSTQGSTTPFLTGTIGVDNGSGGADVGGFSFNMNIGQPLTWTELNTISSQTIQRANGVTVNWTGGVPGTFAEIVGISSSGGTPAVSGGFICIAPVEALKFTVGPDVLLQLPQSATMSEGGFSLSTGFLMVGNASNPVKFTATGLDYGFATFSILNGTTTNYQ